MGEVSPQKGFPYKKKPKSLISLVKNFLFLTSNSDLFWDKP